MQNDPLESALKARCFFFESMFLEGRMGEELDTCPFATGCRRCTYVLGSINSHEISIYIIGDGKLNPITVGVYRAPL